MFNPAKAADEIKKEYIGYISTTFHFRNQNLQKKMMDELYKTVSNGPFVEIKDSFRSGNTIEDLISNGTLSPLFKDLEKDKRYSPKLPVSRPLYLHQEKAIEKIVVGKNVVVSTGTGSGKTNCFVIPVINELLREKEQGKLNDGVRAIFIYPMNALANDQIKGLREILMVYPDIRFGVYNGGTENKEADAIKLYEAMYANEKYPELRKRLPNEELSRDAMKLHPPHILFTNYAMLEHMLFRPGDDTIFTNSNFKYVVLDEAHVYAGATGIETAFLMGRLKGRINGEREPQFILTSATLGDGSVKSNERVVEFAERLTGCNFSADDIITAYRDNPLKSPVTYKYPIQLFIDLANEENFFEDVLKKYTLGITYSQDKEREILYDIISSSDLYTKMRSLGSLITLAEFANKLEISQQEAVAFVSLCANAIKNSKPLVDIRYHYFIKALDGCYLAIDYEDSLSLIRKDYFLLSYEKSAKMFEIAVCEDCGEIAIVGKVVNDKLVRASILDERNFYQVHFNEDLYEYEEDNNEDDIKTKSKKKEDTKFYLCKTCGAIVAEDEAHNNWCTCGNTQKIKISKLTKDDCLNCGGTLRRFNLGYDAATGVVATSLYEQIPEYTFDFEDNAEKQTTKNPFLQKTEKKKSKSKTGSQFLIFSDSRQGAAKFACFLGDSYKEFLRRRGIWNVVTQEENNYRNGIGISDFVGLLDNYFSNLKLFRKSNSDNAESSIVENRRNAWVAVLNEMYNCNRDTSLVSLGKISFEYLGNSDDIVNVVVSNYKLSKEDAKNFLNYLAFEIVRSAAIITDKETDIHGSDREYLYFTPNQKVITKYKNNTLYGSQGFMPTPYTLKNGEKKYYRSNKLWLTKKILKLDDDNAVNFLSNYWDYLVSDSNKYKLQTKDGKGYFLPAKYFNTNFGKNAMLWKCKKCGKVTQFNIGNNCIQIGCDGKLERLNSEEFCNDNYYAMLYKSEKVSPLFVKEHTAQLAKKDALDYQQQFIRKEINALSCSTTFEMGVDVGDLETVFLRNLPPLASNYAQRVGRAGRSINAAAFALTFARLSSHDFTFFDHPIEMINGMIYPPNFTLDNEKILKRHIYAIAISLYLRINPELYSGNNAKAFINEKGYQGFIDWLKSEPKELTDLLKNSISNANQLLKDKYINSYNWLEDFCGKQGIFTKIINEYELNVEYLKKEYEKAMRTRDEKTASVFNRKLERYQKNDLIDFLVRGNILPKYGFPIDSVELTQNIAANNFKSLNLSRDLSVAIAEYAPSGEVVADGGLYTSRYIRKPIVNKSEMSDFDPAYLTTCPECNNINFSIVPIGTDGKPCAICGRELKKEISIKV
jgi:Distinct helicase family with a unique C-terminal domain including a metal-binding cysteine cluster